MRTLVIDDLRSFVDESRPVQYARTAQEGLDLLRRRDWEAIYLDHDLGPEEDSMVVVDYLCERAHHGHRFPVDVIYVHTQNPVGAANIIRSLERYGYHTQRIGVELFTTLSKWEAFVRFIKHWLKRGVAWLTRKSTTN